MGKIKKILNLLIPPIIPRGIKYIMAPLVGDKPYMELAPDGWQTKNQGENFTDWNQQSVAEEEAKKFDFFKHLLAGVDPLGFSHESKEFSDNRNVLHHNIHISYGYVLALAARKKDKIKILDWGGGLGHYYLLSKALLPDVDFDFHCREVLTMCEQGRKLNPDVLFHSDDGCLADKYDLILINGSLQYFPDWKELMPKLAQSSKDYLFLTRVPVSEKGDDYIVFQRMKKYGYNTTFLMHVFNEEELLEICKNSGLKVLREFVVDSLSYPKSALSPYRHKGWLFKKES